MAINFCEHIFRPAIRCDKVSVDGYEVDNIIASKRSAFLSESFVKPPVNIYLSFPCNVDIYRIIIKSAHGAQRSYGFELYTNCRKVASSWLLDDSTPRVADDSGIFLCIGKAYQTEASLFQFMNARYRARSPWRSHVASIESATPLTCKYQTHVSSVRDLCVKITRASGGGVCAVGWLEVWGQPAYSSPPAVITRLLQLHRQSTASESVDLPIADTAVNDGELYANTATADTETTPTEFLDLITTELMSVPMMLPSGHYVDRSTIERHSREEERWGRAPSDPYTGVTFSRGVTPVFDASLKARIDQYLLRRKPSDVKLANGRLLGSSRLAAATGTTNVSRLLEVGGGRNIERNGVESKAIGPLRSTAENRRSKRECGESNFTIDSLPKRICLDSTTNHQTSETNTHRASNVLITASYGDHERKVSDSLQAALAATLGRLPAFKRRNERTQSKATSCECCGMAETHYKLTCDHNICRVCIMQHGTANIQCSNCHRSTARSEVVRMHQL